MTVEQMKHYIVEATMTDPIDGSIDSFMQLYVSTLSIQDIPSALNKLYHHTECGKTQWEVNCVTEVEIKQRVDITDPERAYWENLDQLLKSWDWK